MYKMVLRNFILYLSTKIFCTTCKMYTPHLEEEFSNKIIKTCLVCGKKEIITIENVLSIINNKNVKNKEIS